VQTYFDTFQGIVSLISDAVSPSNMSSKYGTYTMIIHLHRVLSLNLDNMKYLTRVSLNIPLCYRLLDLCKEARYRANVLIKKSSCLQIIV